MSLSSVTISGTLKKDPEKRYTPTSIPVTNLMIEVTYVPRSSQTGKGYSSQVVRVNAWRDLAEKCEQELKAGDKVLVIGRVQINSYTTNDGKRKREIEIDANSIISIEDILTVKLPSTKETSDVEVITTAEEIPF
ncbi:MAG: single-stranded DNA-binding protein [Candidatus Melainabacteria bacterium]|nr:single-stranded DNA-binding protein [Candidatus Melainabacteria bacterium]